VSWLILKLDCVDNAWILFYCGAGFKLDEADFDTKTKKASKRKAAGLK